MAKSISLASFQSNRVASESRGIDQRLQAADEAWKTFMRIRERTTDDSYMSYDLSALAMFSRFVHELISDPKLRGALLHGFEQQLQARIACHETLQ